MGTTLDATQSSALFDILTHYDTYGEIRDFRFPGSLTHYGPPFTAEAQRVSTAPALQTLVTRFLLTLPGLNNLHQDFWKVHSHDIIECFEQSNLSESYDKGIIGIRKTLATAVSALIEYPVRGTFGGFAEIDESHREYDCTQAEDLSRAFRDFMDQCIYGSVLEDLVQKAAETDDLNDHDALTKAVHEFVLVNLASFMHYTLVLSPKGQYLLKLIDSANKMIPYMLVKQTLRIGNVASMINAMVKIGLAKMSITGMTNWIGLTNSKDDGMNLLQHIIATVLGWDIKDLETRASKLERERASLGKQQLQVLKEYASKPREDQEKTRKQSQDESISIVTAVLKNTKLESNLTDQHLSHALEYLSIHLSIRDRREIIRTLCHSHPDHFTTAIRQLVDAYEPVIRGMHNAIDLSGTVGDLECFLRDMIKLSKVQVDRNDKSTVPTVGDFIMLLRKHQFASHTFIHQCCKNGPEVTSWYLAWAKTAASHFRRDVTAPGEKTGKQIGAGNISKQLNELFDALDPKTQEKIVPILDQYSGYLDAMHSQSLARLAIVIRSPASKNPAIAKIFSNSPSPHPHTLPHSLPHSIPHSLSRPSSRPGSRQGSRPQSPAPGLKIPDDPAPTSDFPSKDPDKPTPTVTSDPGPGAYLTRWQDLLDNTPITPLKQHGKVRTASSPEVVNESTADVDGQKMIEFGKSEAKGEKIQVSGSKSKPDVKIVVDSLAGQFRKLLAEESLCW